MRGRGAKQYTWETNTNKRPDSGNKNNERSSTSSGPSPRCSYRSSPLVTPSKKKRKGGKLKFPGCFQRKFDRNGSRVGSSPILHRSSGSIAVSSRAFEDPFVYKNPYMPSFGGPFGQRVELSSQSFDAEEMAPFREPRYLDLFEPGIQVVRDPKLDQPRVTWKEKIRPVVPRSCGFVVPWKIFAGCGCLILGLVVGIASIVSISKLLKFPPDDPRVLYPYVFSATSCGLVRGFVGDHFYSFVGVPYARPPVKALRLTPSKIYDSIEYCWSGNYTANVTRACWSYDVHGSVVSGSEDCLLLDIFTPKLGYENPLPVVFYIGGLSLGSEERRSHLLRNAGPLSYKRNIVIVSPQIRRGFLGFLPSPLIAESVYPHVAGNQGASDIMTALEWVKRNIEHFGGDRNKVTLLGHQAGAGISWPMMHRASSKKLIHFAWLSGAAPVHPISLWRYAPVPILRPFNCSTLNCLKEKRPHTIMDSVDLQWRTPLSRPWLLADGVYVPIEEALPRLPIVLGTTEQTSVEYLAEYRNQIRSVHDAKAAIAEVLQKLLRYNEEPFLQRFHRWREPKKNFTEEDVDASLHYYSSLSSNPWLLFTTLLSDALTTCPTLHRAASLSQQWSFEIPSSREFNPPVYAYISSHQRPTRFGEVADGQSDIEAILNIYEPQSISDRRFQSTLQDLFYTFVETGKMERYGATSAHNGIYAIKDGVSLEQDRTPCNFWYNRTYLARRY